MARTPHASNASPARPFPRRLATVAASALLVVTIAACGQSGPSSTEPVVGTEVSVVDNAFEPANLQVTAGEEVTWTWNGSSDHNVIGDGFESPVQDTGTFTYTFDEPGEYEYVCTLHGGMDGTVVVDES